MENECYDVTKSNQNYMDHLYCHPNDANNTNLTWHNNNNINNNNSNSNSNTKHNKNSNNNNNNNNTNNNHKNLHDKTNIRSNGCNKNNNNNINSNYEFLSKENKQLKSMLILHLDLIQQQADKLALKEMELATRNDETNALRMCIERLETQVSELQKQVQKQLKCAVMERTSVPPPPLAKIQCLHENIKSATTTTKTVALDKMPIKPETPKPDEKTAICAEVKQNAKTNNNSTLNERVLNVVNSNNNNQDIKTVKIKNNHLIKSNENEEIPSCEESTIVESTNKEKIKNTTIENQNINIENQNNSLVKSEDSAIKNDENETQEMKNNNNNNNQSKSISSVPSSQCSSPAQHVTTNPGNNHKKKRRLWHMTHDDEQSIESSEFTSDMETISSSTHSVTPSNLFDKLDSMICGGSSENSHDSKCSSFNSELSIKSSELDTRPTSDALVYCNAKAPYLSRTWLEEELDGELEEEEARALRALEPKLEIPKWTEHEIIPCYSVDGTEDLSDEIFLKRHGKQELDEKRRKKWDVQQIREQRRIDKLRKRHYKDELIQGPVITSFFPLPEDLETICYMDSLPLQAFGESIPKLPGGFNGFALPWLIEADVTRSMRPPRHLLSDFLKLHHKRTTKEALTSSKDDTDKNDKPNVSAENAKLENVEETVNSAELVKMDRDIVMSEENVEQGTEAKSSLSNEEEQKMAVESSNKNLASTTTTTNITITDDKESKGEGAKTASEATSEEILANVNKSCFATPTVMLAQNARSCASRTQMRKRLKYSSYLFISKRKRFQSMSAFTETNSNKLTMNVALSAKNSTTNLKNINSHNLSGAPEVNNEVVEEKVKVPREAMIIAEAKEEEPKMEETSDNMESTIETVTATTNHDDENDEKVRDESKTTKEIMCN